MVATQHRARWSLAFAVLAAAGLYCVFSAQSVSGWPTGPTQATPRAAISPSLNPAEIVNLDTCQVVGSSTGSCRATIPPADASGNPGTFKLYDVPLDRWLVVTDFELATNAVAALAERLGPNTTVLRGFAFQGSGANAYKSSIGLAFEPGSEVLILNAKPTQMAYYVTFNLTGYLVKP